MLSRFSQSAINSNQTLDLALSLVGIHSAAASVFVIRSMSFRCLLKNIKHVSYSYHILIANITISKRGPVTSGCFVFFFFYFCIESVESLQRRFWDHKILLQKRIIFHSSKHYISTSCLQTYNIVVLSSYLGWCKSMRFVMVVYSRTHELSQL